jgi:hypothetical protein
MVYRAASGLSDVMLANDTAQAALGGARWVGIFFLFETFDSGKNVKKMELFSGF